MKAGESTLFIFANNSFFSKENDVKYEIVYKDFPTPLEVCIERDSKRESPIGEKTIRSIYARYKDQYNL